MILEQKVRVKWNSSNKLFYESKGYIYTKMKDEFEVNIKDLSLKSNIIINVICDYCGKNYTSSKNSLSRSVKHCCVKCQPQKFKENYFEKTGYENPSQNPVVKNKIEQTFIKNYGGHPQQNKAVREKTEQTNIKVYGGHPQQNKAVREKTEQTNIKVYGFKCTLQNEKIKEKSKNTIINIYGVENVSQSEEIKNKKIETTIKNYGVDNPMRSEEIKEKLKQTMIKIYGVESGFQINIEKNIIKANQTLYNNSTGVCSRQQKYICNLYNIKPNYPVDKLKLDIVFQDEMIYTEYDGAGHNKSVKCGWIFEKDFKIQELRRYYLLKNKGWKLIRIISKYDLLPSDEIILNLVQLCKDYLNTGHSWIEIDIDKSVIRSNKFNERIQLGELRKILK